MYSSVLNAYIHYSRLHTCCTINIMFPFDSSNFSLSPFFIFFPSVFQHTPYPPGAVAVGAQPVTVVVQPVQPGAVGGPPPPYTPYQCQTRKK